MQGAQKNVFSPFRIFPNISEYFQTKKNFSSESVGNPGVKSKCSEWGLHVCQTKTTRNLFVQNRPRTPRQREPRHEAVFALSTTCPRGGLRPFTTRGGCSSFMEPWHVQRPVFGVMCPMVVASLTTGVAPGHQIRWVSHGRLHRPSRGARTGQGITDHALHSRTALAGQGARQGGVKSGGKGDGPTDDGQSSWGTRSGGYTTFDGPVRVHCTTMCRRILLEIMDEPSCGTGWRNLAPIIKSHGKVLVHFCCAKFRPFLPPPPPRADRARRKWCRARKQAKERTTGKESLW